MTPSKEKRRLRALPKEPALVLTLVLNEKLSSYAFYAQYFQNEQGCRVQKLTRRSIFELATNGSAVCGEMKKNAPYGGGEVILFGVK